MFCTGGLHMNRIAICFASILLACMGAPSAADAASETVLHTFCSQANCSDGALPSGLIEVNGSFYGTTNQGGAGCVGGAGCGTVFALSPDGTQSVLYVFCQQANCADGAYPDEQLLDVKGILYGTTVGGGVCRPESRGCGTVFALDPRTGTETVLHSFCQQR